MVIKNIAFCDKNKLRNLMPVIEPCFGSLDFLNPFISALHSFIPFKFKFLQETFVSLEGGNPNGFVTINKTGKKQAEISSLFIQKNSFSNLERLLDFVVSLYIVQGAETFFINSNKENYKIVKDFTSRLGFRESFEERVYKFSKNSFSHTGEVNFGYIKNTGEFNPKEIKALIYENISSSKRVFYEENIKKYLKTTINKKSQALVDNKKNILSLFTLERINKNSILLYPIVKCGFETYLEDIINFVFMEFLQTNKAETIFVKISNAHLNFSKIQEILDTKFKEKDERIVFVKSYFATQKYDNIFENIILNDITPAF